MRIDAESLDDRSTYALITSMLIPRPIAWVGTRSGAGVDNLAPFSYFMGVSSRPPLVAISVAHGRNGALKDTARNLLDTRVCTISVGSWSQLEALHASSASFPPEISEFEALNIPMLPGERVQAPRVAEAKVAFEATLHQTLSLPSNHLFLLEVIAYHLVEEVLTEGKVDPAKLDPIARLGLAYAPLGPVKLLPRV